VLATLVLVLSACGSGSSSDAGSRTHTSAGHSAAGATATRGAGVPAASVAVIEGWANALRAGKPARAASYWAHPSVMVNGPNAAGQVTLIHIDDARDARLADETLSCGAKLRSTKLSEGYVEGAFTLSVRTGAGASSSGCSGPASVDFTIQSDHIVRWLRAPLGSSVPPGGATPAAKSVRPQSV
jgi:hypothetical protein